MTKNNLEATKLFPGEERPYELLSVWLSFLYHPFPAFWEKLESKKNMAD